MDQKESKTGSVISENRGYVTPAEVQTLPETFGVYLMKDNDGRIIYVGKAINLRKRVSSYFTDAARQSLKTTLLVGNVAIIDYIKVHNESEALILEANLIKEYQPRYNVVFKDNKFYPSIKVTVHEDFPRVVFTRDQRKDGSKYFGPYTSANAVRTYIDLIQRIFKIRSCYEMPKRECLLYHINRCSGPCIGRISREEYAQNVKEVIDLLTGNLEVLMESLQSKMQLYSKALLYEKAQSIKEKIDAIRLFDERQNVYLPGSVNAEFVGMAEKMGRVVFVAITIRGGKMIGKKSFSAVLQMEMELPDILESFFVEYFKTYDKKAEFIFIDPEYKKMTQRLGDYLRSQRDRAQVKVPSNEKQKSILKMASENAALHLSQVLSKIDLGESLKDLQEVLHLDTLPMRIEGFDIANIMGENAVASLISFYGGKPDKANYRHFKIRSKAAPDDTGMVKEAVYRRYKKLKEEGKELPDLILIDGGKGQLNAALAALAELGMNLNAASLAKKNEEIYTPYLDAPIILPRNSQALHILQQVRDETHRFANAFYNELKAKDMLTSIFAKIKGIGKKRKQIIVQKFVKYDIIETLKVQDIINEGVPKDAAKEVLKKLKKVFKSLNE